RARLGPFPRVDTGRAARLLASPVPPCPLVEKSAGPPDLASGVALMVEVLCLAGGSLAGLLVGFAICFLRDRAPRARGESLHAHALAQSDDIIAQARKEADNLYKEADLRAKDELFQKRNEFNIEMEKGRAEIREQERRLEKREDAAEQKQRELSKKERIVEH